MTDRWLIRHCIPRGGAVVLWTGSNTARVQQAADHVRAMLLAEGLSVPTLKITPNSCAADFDAGRAMAKAGAVPFVLAVPPGCHNPTLYFRYADVVLAVGNDGFVQLCKGGDVRTVSQHYRSLSVIRLED